MEAKEETVRDSIADQNLAKDPEKGMCSDLPLQFPEHNSESLHKMPSLSHNQNEGLNENKDTSMGEPDIETISAAMPSLDLNCEDVWPPLVPPVPHTPCPYNLRSSGGKPGSSGSVRGLGQLVPQGFSKNKRGQKSDLSKAKLKAKLDVDDGKQHSIPGVLRAVQTPDFVIK